MATHARQQYFADENSLSKERREFSIADDIQEKIDSVEEGAQVNRIETVKVNGTALVPDANKAVNVEVPDVIDNLYTVDSDNALSAKQGKLLYDYIQNIASRGRFLSNWNSATGLPMTNPSESPYPYKSGDYFNVSNVASGGGTNYRPDGSSYIIGQASTVVETEDVSVSDFYFYDGTNWLLLSNSGRQIAIDSSLSTTSTNPVENRVITNALNGKQDTLTAGNHIDITNNVISAEGFQEELTAGENITIGDICTTESDMKGPCPSGFHVPLNTEWQAVYDIWTALGGGSSDGTNFGIALKLPFAGRRKNSSAGVDSQGTYGSYWSSTRNDNNSAYRLYFNSSDIGPQSTLSRTNGCSVRCFKNSPTVPTSSWTKLYGISIESGGIFWSSTEGLISMSSDGQTWITIADKNLGATTVWNSGDTLSEANCGKYYQWGNNYGFPRTGSVTTSSTQVDASNYGPGNYYSSDTFIKYGGRWDSGDNGNLWGGVTQGTWQECIHNVISAIDTKYTAGTGINIDANNEISNTLPGAIVSATAPSNPAEGMLWYDTTNDQLKVYDGTNWNVTGKEYNAGEGISIGTAQDYSAMQGPCPEGFHVPSNNEYSLLKTIFDGLSLSGGINRSMYLKMPFSGNRSAANPYIYNTGTDGYYWSSTRSLLDSAYSLRFNSTNINPQIGAYPALGYPIRPLKDTPVIPDSSWATLYDGSSVAPGAGIFHNATLGLISISSDGAIWFTITDKNLGATTVYNYGDTLSEANCGKYYQRGNNYGFPGIGNNEAIITSNTKVDSSTYGPGNYYYSSTLILVPNSPYTWDTVNNGNLRGGVTGVITINNAITNTGVLSVNGQTGNVTLPAAEIGLSSETGNVLTAGAKIWTGDETDMPATPDSNTLYFCY